MVFLSEDWINFIVMIINQYIEEDNSLNNEWKLESKEEMNQIQNYARNKIAGYLLIDADTSPIVMSSHYDILNWLKQTQAPLNEFKLKEPLQYIFVYTDEQIQSRKDLFHRFGSEISGLTKFITRNNHKNFFRTINTTN